MRWNLQLYGIEGPTKQQNLWLIAQRWADLVSLEPYQFLGLFFSLEPIQPYLMKMEFFKELFKKPGVF